MYTHDFVTKPSKMLHLVASMNTIAVVLLFS